MTRHVITGGLGTGKTSLLAGLGRQFETVPEPARELIAEHRAATGERSLDLRPELFVHRLIERSLSDYRSASDVVTVFDRGLPDCVAYASVYGVDTRPALEAARRHRYQSPVLVAPPWEEIYVNDDMRTATFSQAEAFHGEVVDVYEGLGYELVELPKASIEDRVSVVTAWLPHLRAPGDEP